MNQYAVALIHPSVSCTTCEINRLTEKLYDLFAPYMQIEEKHTVDVGGEFFGQVKGFKLSSNGYRDQDIVNMNTVSVQEHIMYGYKPDFLVVNDTVYQMKLLTEQAYRDNLAHYLHYTAVGYEIGGEWK